MQLSFLSFFKKIGERQDLKTIITNASWLFLDRIFRIAANLTIGVWVARYLGIEKYGILMYATAFSGLFSIFSTLGIPSIIVRMITNKPEHKERILGTSFYLQLIGGVATWILASSSILFIKSNDPVIIKLVIVISSSVLFNPFNTIDLWFQSQIRSKYSVLAKNLGFSLSILLKLMLIQSQAPLIMFGLAQLCEASIGALGLALSYHRQGYFISHWRWSFSLSKIILRESWPLILSGLAVVVYMKADQIMLGEIIDNKAVGLYSCAARISEIWYFIPTAIGASFAPSIYKAKKEETEQAYYQRIEKLLKLLFRIAILITIPMSLSSDLVITILFGKQYIAAAPILAIHIWAALFAFIGIGTSSWFIAEGLSNASFIRTLGGAIINIVLNVILIPKYGGIGAAIATVISYAIASFLLNAFDSRTKRIFNIQLKAFNIFCR